MRKNYIYNGLIVIVIIAAALGLFYWQKHRSASNSASQFPATVNRQLNDAQKKYYQDRLSQGQKFLSALNKSSQTFKSDSRNGYIYLAQQYDGLGELAKARDNYNVALQFVPDDENIFVGLAQVQDEQGDFAGAVSSYEKATELSPQDSDAWIKYINYRNVHFHDSSATLDSLYAKALDKTGRKIDVLSNYAAFKLAQGATSTALSLYKEAAQKDTVNKQFDSIIKQLESGK